MRVLDGRFDPGPSTWWSWRLRAACRQIDSAVFFPSDEEQPAQRNAREAQAKAICGRCPVILPCAAYAIRHGERYGVWGGLSERERMALIHEPDQAPADASPADADPLR